MKYGRNTPLIGNSGDLDASTRTNGYVLAWNETTKRHEYVAQGTDPTVDLRLDTLEETNVRVTRFAEISSGTSGTIAIPTNNTIVLNGFGAGADCAITKISGGLPLYENVVTASNEVVTSTFDTNGSYVLSGTPSAYPIALCYTTLVQLQHYNASDADIIDDNTVIPTHEQMSGLLGGAANDHQHLTTTQVNALHDAVTVSDSDSIDLTITGQQLTATYKFPGQQVIVAKTNGQYSTIQAAIDSILDASATKPYAIKVMPGIYEENVTLKDYVFIENGISGSTTIKGRVSATGITGVTGMRGFTLSFIPTADGQIGVEFTGGSSYVIDNEMYITGSADYAVTGFSINPTIGTTTINNGVIDRRTGNITKNFVGMEFAGTGTRGVFSSYVSMRGAYTNGTICLFKIGGTGAYTENSCIAIFGSTSAFSGTVRGGCCETATSATRLIQGRQVNLSVASGGTGTGFHLDSGGNSANMTYSQCLLSLSGFTTRNITDTDVGDTQRIFNLSCAATYAKAGSGLAVITPFDMSRTGFDQWSTVGATYWSYNVGTAVFTLDKRCTGIVKDAPVVAAAAQTVTLTNNADNYIYVDSEGVLKRAASNTGLFSDNVVLFELYSDGTNYICKKENHPVDVDQGMSTVWHKLQGTLLENNGGGNITILSGAGRTLKMVGDTVAHDHGLTTTIPDSAGAAMSFTSLYTGASGMVIDGTGITAIPSKWQNTASTVANASNGDRTVVRIGVIMDNLNSSAPQYVFSYHNAVYANTSAANTAIANDIAGTPTILAFPSATTALEILQLGYAVIQADGSGGGTLVSVTVAKQVANATRASAGAATAGNTITDVTNFNELLTSSETTVQAALNRLDDFGAIVNGLTAKTTPADNDMVLLMDSAASNVSKKLSWANIKATLKTYMDTLYMALSGDQSISGNKTFSDKVITPSLEGTTTAGVAIKGRTDGNSPGAGMIGETLTGTPIDTNTTVSDSTGYTAASIVLNKGLYTLQGHIVLYCATGSDSVQDVLVGIMTTAGTPDPADIATTRYMTETGIAGAYITVNTLKDINISADDTTIYLRVYVVNINGSSVSLRTSEQKFTARRIA